MYSIYSGMPDIYIYTYYIYTVYICKPSRATPLAVEINNI